MARTASNIEALAFILMLSHDVTFIQSFVICLMCPSIIIYILLKIMSHELIVSQNAQNYHAKKRIHLECINGKKIRPNANPTRGRRFEGETI